MTMLVPEPKASTIRYSDLPHKILDIATPNIPNDRRKIKIEENTVCIINRKFRISTV